MLKPLKRRAGFLTGAVIFLFIISFLEGFVWNVEIVGNSVVSDSVLLSYLESGRLESGVMWSSIDTDELEWKIMSDFDDIAWVHINRIGTTARVEISETSPKPTADSEEKLKGTKVLRKELEAVAYRRQSKITLLSQKNYTDLIFFSVDIPLYLNIEKGDIEEQYVNMLTIKGVELPLGITVKTEKYLSSEQYNLTDDELLSLAEKKLLYLEQKELDGYTIVNRCVTYDTDDDKCTIKCAYILRVEN